MRAPLTLVVLTMLLLAACSVVQLAYRNADVLIGLEADDMLDLDAGQRAAWRPLLEDVLARHRERELPRIVATLGRLERGARDGFDAPGLECIRSGVWAAWRGGATLLAEAAAPLLADLRPAQVAHLRARLAAHNAEFRAEHLAADPFKRHAARVARMVGRIERWSGPLNGAQRALVNRHVAGWPPLARRWFDYGLDRQARLLAMLERHAPRRELQQFLTAWWAMQADMPARLLADRAVVETGMERLLIALQATLEDGQRERLVEEIGGLRRSLAALLPEASVAAAVAAMPCTPGAGIDRQT